jgi:hypothetical protein
MKNQGMNKRLKVFGFAIAVIFITGCAGTAGTGTADEVQVFMEEQVTDCLNVGATHVSVNGRVGQPDQSQEQVAMELRKLGKNGAVQLGGNVIVEMTRVVDGAQSFAVFRCSH